MADVEVTNTIDVVGLDNIKLKLELPQPLKTENDSTFELKPLEVKPLKADLGTDIDLSIDPLKLELEAKPLKTDSSLSVDLKPAVVDLCLTTNIGKLPNVCIHQPYHHHFAFTLYGTEVWGFTYSGQQDTVIEDVDRQPKVVWGGDLTTEPVRRRASHASVERPSRQAGGIRVRLEP